MIHSLRLPVGCDALNKMGHQVLPHQLAESFDEFRIVVNAMGKVLGIYMTVQCCDARVSRG